MNLYKHNKNSFSTLNYFPYTTKSANCKCLYCKKSIFITFTSGRDYTRATVPTGSGLLQICICMLWYHCNKVHLNYV